MLKLKINSMAKQQDGSYAMQVIVYDINEPKTTLSSFTQKIEKNYDKKEVKNKLKSKIKGWKDTETGTEVKDDMDQILSDVEGELF